MKKRFTLLTIASLFPLILLGETPNEREFKELREQREKALAAAVQPINQRYKASLEQLLRRSTQAVELDLARQVQAELQAIAGATAATAATATPPPLVPAGRPATRSEIKQLLEESEWTYYETPEPDSPPTGSIIFHKAGKNGHALSDHAFNAVVWYEIQAPDLILIYHSGPQALPPQSRVRVFRLDYSTKTARFEAKLSSIDGKGSLKYKGPVNPVR